MNERKKKLAKFLERSREKTAARGSRRRHSRTRVDKDRLKCLDKFHESKKTLSKLRAEKEKLDAQLADTEKDMHACRSDMLRLTNVLRNMDLLDCNYVMIHDNSDDVGYLIDKEEHHLEVDDQGDCSLTPMSEYLRNKRKAEKSNLTESLDEDDTYDSYDEYEEDEDDQLDVNDASDESSVGGFIPGIDRLSDSEAPRTEEEHDEIYEEGKEYPNFRLI